MKLEINNRWKTGKFSNEQKLNNTLFNNLYVKEEITKEIRKYFEEDKNKNNISNGSNVVKAVLRSKFIIASAYIKKRRKISSQHT